MNAVVMGEEFNGTLSFFPRLRVTRDPKKKKKKSEKIDNTYGKSLSINKFSHAALSRTLRIFRFFSLEKL